MSAPLQDKGGTQYGSPDGKPAQSNVPVTIYGPNGGTPGVMVDGYAVPTKK